MRDARSSYSLDKQGLSFASKTVFVLIAVFGIVHYGTIRASEYVMTASMRAEAQPAAVAVTAAPVPPQTEDTLSTYEQTLSARITGSAAFDTLIRARARMIQIRGEQISLMENGRLLEELPFTKESRLPTGLSMAYTTSQAGDVFAEVHFPGCTISTPQPTHEEPACIQVGAEHMLRIVEFVGEGVPVYVLAEERVPGTAPEKSLPRVSAKAFIVADLTSGDIYAEKDADTARPIASISKLFTALVARETIRDDRTMTVTRDDQLQTEGVPGSIRAGESFTVDELLYPLLMESNNSAAYTLARYEGIEQFIERVNQKTQALGMNATRLDDPSGLSANNVSSPRDLVTFLGHIQKYHSLLFDITEARTKTLRAENGRTYRFTNFNHFAGDDGFIGGKTGFINEAGQTYAGVFEVPSESGTSTIAIVVLGSEDRKKDTAALLSWFRDR